MSEETPQKRNRKTNPFSQYAKATEKAERARRAAARAGELAEKAKAAAERAAELAAKKEEAEAAEAAAYEVLQSALADLHANSDDEAGDE